MAGPVGVVCAAYSWRSAGLGSSAGRSPKLRAQDFDDSHQKYHDADGYEGCILDVKRSAVGVRYLKGSPHAASLARVIGVPYQGSGAVKYRTPALPLRLATKLQLQAILDSDDPSDSLWKGAVVQLITHDPETHLNAAIIKADHPPPAPDLDFGRGEVVAVEEVQQVSKNQKRLMLF